MTKTEAIKDASIKAALVKSDQVVFEYISGKAGKDCMQYDYTAATIWNNRRHLLLPATFVTDVKYNKQPEK